MKFENSSAETTTLENDRPATEQGQQWVTPEYVEESACAEICAYVFTA